MPKIVITVDPKHAEVKDYLAAVGVSQMILRNFTHVSFEFDEKDLESTSGKSTPLMTDILNEDAKELQP